jgi:hypothetical protein
MAKKAELEIDFRQYQASKANMLRAQKEGQYQAALDFAVSSFNHIDGMMQFDRKYRGQTECHSVDTIDFVLKYAPLLFDYESLDKVEELLKSQRRIEKNTTADLAEALASARSKTWDCYRLWTLIENSGEVAANDLKHEPLLRSIANSWRKLGILRHKVNDEKTQVFVTRLDDKVRGKCPSCGATGAGAKVKLIEPITCPRCKQTVCFVLLAD